MTIGLSLEKSFISSLWTRLTEPHPDIQDVGQRRQARLISSLTLMLSIVGVLAVLVVPLTDNSTSINATSVFSIVLVIGLYGFSRTRHYQLTAVMLLVVTVVAIIIPTLNMGNASNRATLNYLIITLLLGSMLLPLRGTALTGAALVVIIIAVSPSVPANQNVSEPLTIIGICTAMLLVFLHHRNGLERDRQAQLTAALAKAGEGNTALVQSQMLLRLVMDTIPQNICWKDHNSVYLGCNSNFAKTLNLPSAEWIVGKTDYDLESAANAEFYQSIDRRVMESDTPELNFEEPQPHADGSVSWLQTSKVPLHDNADKDKVTGVLVMFEDITERKQVQEELKRSKQMLQLVMDTIPQNICWKDRNSVYLGSNRNFAKILGFEFPEQLIGKTDFDIPGSIENAAEYQAMDRAVMEADTPQLNFEEPLQRGDGKTSWLNTSKVPLHDANGAVTGVLVMFEDITPRKRQEQEREILIQELKEANDLAAESARLKSEFMSTMSHELRTPLNAIRGFTGIMLEGMGGVVDEEAQHMLGRIDSNSVRLLGLINDLLDIAKIEAGRMELVNEAISPQALAERWRSLTSVLAEQKGLKLDVRVDPELPETVYGDSERLTQIVTNLLSNAIKFTHQGRVALDMKTQGEQWIIQVSDTGIGIPPHAINYIFDEFRQVDGSTKRAYGGGGLGLAIVRNLCRMMKGNVKVTSELGKGSVFTVTLPLVADRRSETQLLELA